jgi:hypothetical protein
MSLMGIAKFERFFRLAAGIDSISPTSGATAIS